MSPSTPWYRQRWFPAATIAILLWSQFAWVSPTNFHGFDEWLIFSLVSRGIISFPYANRPVMLMWNLPAARFADPLIAHYVLHGAYLALSGVLVFLLVRRLAPDRGLLAWLAGAFAATWAPGDRLRLDSVQMVPYSGFMTGMLLSLLLLVEWWLRGRAWTLAAACALALATARGYEGVFPLLFGAPILLALAAPVRSGWRWALAWYGVLGVGVAQVLGAMRGAPETLRYQRRLGADLSLLDTPGRLLQHYGFELLPLVQTPWRDLAVPGVVPTVGLFCGAVFLVFRVADTERRGRTHDAVAIVAGLILAGLGWGLIATVPALTTPIRTQFLPAPGIGLALAGATLWLASWLPRRWRLVGVAMVGGWIMWVGTARILSLQREWNTISAFPGQNRLLRELTRLAPDLRPNTLVVLVDRTSWWRPFSFRHAIEYVYDGRASGYLWSSLPNRLYPTRFSDAGVITEPEAPIRGPWRAPATLHRYEELVVVDYAAGGSVRILEEWPTEMYRLPPGATYEPFARIAQSGFEPRSRAALRPLDVFIRGDGLGGPEVGLPTP